MKRIGTLWGVIFIVASLFAQNLTFENIGAPVSQKDSVKIIQMIDYEIDFYNKIYLLGDVRIKLKLIDNEKEYAILKSQNRSMERMATGGFFSMQDSVCYVNRAKLKKNYLPVVYHEISHYFTRMLLQRQPPRWLAEGLSEYFEHSDKKKKGVKHYLTDYEKGRIRTMIELKEIDLKKFIALRYNDFAKKQITDENYAYILAHGIVYFLVEKDFEQFKAMMLELKNRKSSFVAIDNTYQGGFSAFETDFISYYSK